MFDTDKEGSLFIWLAAAAVTAICALHFLQHREDTQPAPQLVASRSPQQTQSNSSTKKAAPIASEADSRQDSLAIIYECRVNGLRTLSSTPCGPDAKAVAIQQPNRMNAQDTSRLYEHVYPPAGASPSATQDWSDATRSRQCEAIDQSIEWIDARMREGYRNGEHYRERLRQLKEERWELKCRWVKTPEAMRH